MIDIPEERILKEITEILMNDLPKVLLELEEQSEDSIRLPPFRYVGLEENLSAGTPLPYALMEIEEGEYTEKDRIVRKTQYIVSIHMLLLKNTDIWGYSYALRHILMVKQGVNQRYKEKCYQKGLFRYIITQ